MKRFAFILLCLAALSVLSFTSCDTNNVQQVYLNTKTLRYPVFFNDWKVGTDDSGDYLYYTFSEPQLTRDIFNYGLIIPYMEFSDGTLSPLPFSDFWIDSTYGNIEEQVTCEISPGYVTFILKADDHGIDPYHYDEYDFLLKLAW